MWNYLKRILNPSEAEPVVCFTQFKHDNWDEHYMRISKHERFKEIKYHNKEISFIVNEQYDDIETPFVLERELFEINNYSSSIIINKSFIKNVEIEKYITIAKVKDKIEQIESDKINEEQRIRDFETNKDMEEMNRLMEGDCSGESLERLKFLFEKYR